VILMKKLLLFLAFAAVLCGQVVSPPRGAVGPSATPGSPAQSLQYNDAGSLAAVPGSYVRPNGTVEFGPWFSTPQGGVGSFQNFFNRTNYFGDTADWTLTDVTIGSTDTLAPDGSSETPGTSPTGGGSEVIATDAGGNIEECYNTGSALTGRTFTLSAWIRYPSVAVTPKFVVRSTTPTTAFSTTVAVTTSWQRVAASGTFGVDAGTTVCGQFQPNGAGSGTLYIWGTQLEESDRPTVFHNADNGFAMPIRQMGVTFANNEGGPLAFNYGNNRMDGSGDNHIIGFDNWIKTGTGGGWIIGNSSIVSGSVGKPFVFGRLAEATNGSMVIGFGNASSPRIVNDVTNSVCIAGYTRGNASDGQCTILAKAGSGTAVGKTQFGAAIENASVAFAALAAAIGTNGNQIYCSDCTVTSGIDNTCAGSGNGAWVTRVNGVSKCVQ
jgi:hypothetical protein